MVSNENDDRHQASFLPALMGHKHSANAKLSLEFLKALLLRVNRAD